MAVRLDVTPESGWFTGEDTDVRIIVWADAAKTVRRNITGYALSYLVKRKKTQPDAAAFIDHDNSGGISITDGAQGELVLTMTRADIAAIKGGVLYWHELKRVDAGHHKVLLDGTFMLAQAVHQ